MKFKIVYDVNFNEDEFIIEGENIEEIREKVKSWLTSRGLTMDNYLYSEEIEVTNEQ